MFCCYFGRMVSSNKKKQQYASSPDLAHRPDDFQGQDGAILQLLYNTNQNPSIWPSLQNLPFHYIDGYVLKEIYIVIKACGKGQPHFTVIRSDHISLFSGTGVMVINNIRHTYVIAVGHNLKGELDFAYQRTITLTQRGDSLTPDQQKNLKILRRKHTLLSHIINAPQGKQLLTLERCKFVLYNDIDQMEQRWQACGENVQSFFVNNTNYGSMTNTSPIVQTMS